jgi:hypothetical protein
MRNYCGGGEEGGPVRGNGCCAGRRRAHGVDGGGEEAAILDRALGADDVANLNIGQGDGVAALAEGGVLVGREGVGALSTPSMRVTLTPSMAVTLPMIQVLP